MKEIDKVTEKRLVYVKRLYMHAQEHMSDGTEFDRMISIHHLDNAIELLLGTVAASYGISFKDPLRVTFYNLWNTVNEKHREKQGSELPNKTEMFYLHRIRSDVQHLGITPFSLENVKDLDTHAYHFMQTILSSVFSLEFKELFMSSLVNDVKIRGFLKEAEKYFAAENWKEAIANVSVAFALAREQRSHLVPAMSIGFEHYDERLDILALGLDIAEYRKFVGNTPTVLFADDNPALEWTKELNFSKENTLFCLNFVLESILRWGL